MTESRSDVSVDVISSAPPFDLAFYRQLARNGYESPARLQPLNPWTVAPSFYVRTITEDAGQPIEDAVIQGIRRIVVNSVPELTGHRFSVAAFETGAAARAAEAGWVNVVFYGSASNMPGGEAGGRAVVGADSGTISLLYDPTPCPVCVPACPSFTEWNMDHEIVHAMGYYHTADGKDFHSADGCPGSGRPARVQYHAAVVYSRVRGNTDPDTDPSTFAMALAASSASISVVFSCPLPAWFTPPTSPPRVYR